MREKKIYCGAEYLEVDIFRYTDAERDAVRKGGRSKKEVETCPRLLDWNDRNAQRRFTWLVNTNFTDDDLHVSLTYDNWNLPPTIEDAERECRNFIARVNRRRKKEGLHPTPMKYISIPACTFKADGVTPARIHHHIIMSGGLSREVIEDLWRKRRQFRHKKGERLGHVNADRLSPEGNGFAGLCKYLSKQAGGKRRWNSSQNLEQPETVTEDADKPGVERFGRFSASRGLDRPRSRTNDHKYSKRQVEQMATSSPDVEYWERKYPGYTLQRGDYAYQPMYSETRGWSLYVKLRRIKRE